MHRASGRAGPGWGRFPPTTYPVSLGNRVCSGGGPADAGFHLAVPEGSRSSAGFRRAVPGRFKALRWVSPGRPREVHGPPLGFFAPYPGGSRSSVWALLSREVQGPPSGLSREVQGPPSGFCCPGRFNVLRGVVRGRPGKFNVLRLGCAVPREAQGPPRGCAGRPGRFKVLRRGSRPGGSRSSVWVVCPGRFNVLRLGLAIPGRFNALLGLCLAVPGRFKVLLRGSAAPGGSRSSVGAAPVPAPGNGAVPFPAPGRSSPAPGLAVLAPGPSAPATSRPRWEPEKNGPADPLKPQRDRGRPGYLIGDLFCVPTSVDRGGRLRPVGVPCGCITSTSASPTAKRWPDETDGSPKPHTDPGARGRSSLARWGQGRTGPSQIFPRPVRGSLLAEKAYSLRPVWGIRGTVICTCRLSMCRTGCDRKFAARCG